MNAYLITPQDGVFVETDRKEKDFVMVHGAVNWGIAQHLLDMELTLDFIRKCFCMNCGGFTGGRETCPDCNGVMNQSDNRFVITCR